MAKFSFTIPSLAAKNANTCLIKCFSSAFNFVSQSVKSEARSISSAVQKLASACLYICQISLCFIGNSTKRSLFSVNKGSFAISYLLYIFCQTKNEWFCHSFMFVVILSLKELFRFKSTVYFLSFCFTKQA